MPSGRMIPSWIPAVLLAVFGLTASLPVAAQSPTFPASWAGIWTFDTVEYDCGSSTVNDTYQDVDTLCTGQPMGFEEEGYELDCTGTITDTNIDVECSTMVTEGPCTITFTYTVQGMRSGDTVTGTETFSITYDGCGPISDSCTEGDITGTRTAPEPAFCNAPVEPATWGSIKATFGSE